MTISSGNPAQASQSTIIEAEPPITDITLDPEPDSTLPEIDATTTLTTEIPDVANRPTNANRPWLLETPAGSTAYVLDRNSFLLSARLEGSSSQLGLPPLLSARFGLLDSVTIGIASPVSTPMDRNILILGDVKWNFLNSELWSFAARVWTGGTRRAERGETQAPYAGELTASYVLAENAKLHIGLMAASNHKLDRWGYSSSHFDGENWVVDYVVNEDHESHLLLRATAAVEWRVSQSSGFTFSLSPQLMRDVYDRQGTSGTVPGGGMDPAATAGVAYHYYTPHLGFAVGIEAGPRLENLRYYNSEQPWWNYSYSRTQIMTSASATLDYLF